MRFIRPCSSCGGPVTIRMAKCPNCSQRNPVGVVVRAVSKVMVMVGGVSVSSTLAACYGAPCASTGAGCPTAAPPTCDEVSRQPKIDDIDGDGYCLAYDCNEKDPKIHAGATEIKGDDVDQDCDGVVDR